MASADLPTGLWARFRPEELATPEVARQGGALIVEVNLQPTPLSTQADFVVTGPAAHSLPAIAQAPCWCSCSRARDSPA